MKTNWTFLMLVVAAGMAPAAVQAAGRPLVVNNLTGTLRIEQGIPCDDDVDQTTPVTGGRLEISPPEGLSIPGGKRYALLTADISFAGFSIHRSCLGFDETRNYSVVRVQLARALSFDALPSTPSLYVATIPKEHFLIRDVTVVNGDLASAVKRPKEDVTGILDLAQGTLKMKVVVGNRVRFRAGCVGSLCLIDEEHDGTSTADLSGTFQLPDTDGDGVPDVVDNCPLIVNRDQGPVDSPAVRGPADLTVFSCAERRIGPIIAVDVCHDLPVTVTDDAPDPFRPGPNAVVWTVQDAEGHVVTRRQTVTVEDKTPPLFTSVPADVAADNCGPVPLGSAPTTEDDCGGAPVIANDAPREFAAGRTVVRWTASDLTGNQAVAEQTVTVTDRMAPDLACVPGADADEGGEIGYYRVSAHDACDVPAIRLGAFALADGEVIRVTRSREPGVELLGVLRSGVRHFRVGPGDQEIEAADKAGNASRTACWPLRQEMWPSRITRGIR